MTTKQIKDVKSNTQTQTKKEEHIMDDKQKAKLKANYNGVLYDISKQIKFNIQKRYMKISYLDTRIAEHKAIADRVIKNLSEAERQVLKEYKDIIDKLAITIGEDIKAQWIQDNKHKAAPSKTINTQPTKEDVSIINLHFNDYIIVIDKATGIVRTITNTGTGNQVTKCKVNSHWIYVARPLNPTLLDKVKTLIKK
jgi:hypothetical protein